MLVRYFKKAKYFHLTRVFSPIIGLVSLVLNVESVKQNENSNKFVAVFSVDVAFVSATSELPDIATQNSTNDDKKGHKATTLVKRSHLETLKVYLFGEHWFVVV